MNTQECDLYTCTKCKTGSNDTKKTTCPACGRQMTVRPMWDTSISNEERLRLAAMHHALDQCDDKAYRELLGDKPPEIICQNFPQ